MAFVTTKEKHKKMRKEGTAVLQVSRVRKDYARLQLCEINR